MVRESAAKKPAAKKSPRPRTRAARRASRDAREQLVADAIAAKIAAPPDPQGDNLNPIPSRFGYLPKPLTSDQQWHVAVLAAAGYPQDAICVQLGISEHTLRERFAGSLKKGTEMATAMVAETLFRKALGDGNQSVAAAIFWLKARAHWREVSVVENNVNVKLSVEDRQKLIEKMQETVARIPPARQIEIEQRNHIN